MGFGVFAGTRVGGSGDGVFGGWLVGWLMVVWKERDKKKTTLSNKS